MVKDLCSHFDTVVLGAACQRASGSGPWGVQVHVYYIFFKIFLDLMLIFVI